MKNKLIMALVGLFLLTGCGVEVVNTGYRGVKTNFGKVVGGTLDEGLYFYNPFTSSIHELDVQVQRLNYNTAAYTKDAQEVQISLTANLYPDRVKMHTFYSNFRYSWQDRLVEPIVLGNVKAVVGKFIAVDLISRREEAVTEMRELVKAELSSKDILLVNFEVPDFSFNEDFERAVERKVIAIQQAEESKNKTVRIREEARQKLLTAEADAKAMRIKAEALTRNKTLVEWEAIKKWDGTLPRMMFGGGGALPLINLDGVK